MNVYLKTVSLESKSDVCLLSGLSWQVVVLLSMFWVVTSLA